MPSCLPLRFSDKPLPGRNRLTPHSLLLSARMHVCVCVWAPKNYPNSFFSCDWTAKARNSMLEPFKPSQRAKPTAAMQTPRNMCMVNVWQSMIKMVILQTVVVLPGVLQAQAATVSLCVCVCAVAKLLQRSLGDLLPRIILFQHAAEQVFIHLFLFFYDNKIRRSKPAAPMWAMSTAVKCI